MVDPVRPIALQDIEEARERVSGTVLRTPLVRVDGVGRGDIYPQARKPAADQCLQDPRRDERRCPALRTSSERAACGRSARVTQGRASLMPRARLALPCSVVAIETAPQTKLDRMRALGATIVPVSYEEAWKAAEAHAFEGMDGNVHSPFRQLRFHRRTRDDGAGDRRRSAGGTHGDRRDRRRRADHRRRKRDKGCSGPT